jgi:IS605 OrfB family transposase
MREENLPVYMKTYNAKLKNINYNDCSVLSSFGKLFAKVKHNLFQDLYKNKLSLNELKKRYQKRFGINARHFNSIADQLKGQVKNERENLKHVISIYNRKIQDLYKSIASLDRKLKNSNSGKVDKKKLRFILHQRKRKLFNFQGKLKKSQARMAGDIPQICFGGRKFFKIQHNLSENQFADHQEWKERFKLKREGEVYFLGSSDRTLGNGNCHFVHLDAENNHWPTGKRNALKITLPRSIIKRHDLSSKYLYLKNVIFPDDKSKKKAILGEANFGEIIENYLQPDESNKAKGPITYRINIGDDSEIRIAATIRDERPEIVTKRDAGAIGVDVNNGFISVGTIDRFGNPISAYNLGMSVKGKSKRQSLEIVRITAQKVVDRAMQLGVPIVIESLDFRAKKCQNHGSKMNFLLSSLPYRKFQEQLQSICSKKGIEIIYVNPAFSSVIGFGKFCRGYGLSTHQGAAIAVARRGLSFGEKLGTRSARLVPVEFFSDLNQAKSKDVNRHVWKKWSNFAKNLNNHKLTLLGIHSSFEKT